MNPLAFSKTALCLQDSITHGTKASLDTLNKNLPYAEQSIDLSIGTLDIPVDKRIDKSVMEFVEHHSTEVHDFAPVKGFPFLREAIAQRIYRLHQFECSPEEEILVTPGGIKGALTVAFHAFLDPGDEVIVPIPHWPHYPDMIRLHGAVPRFVIPPSPHEGLDPSALESAFTDRTKLVILGDCINPTGKVYSSEELEAFALLLARENRRRAQRNQSPVAVVFDCPYEAHVFGPRPKTFAALHGSFPEGGMCTMKEFTVTVTGPGKTYGMHGDRLGYAYAAKEILAMMARVQVNLNSFASTYAQKATHTALQEEMDSVATGRAQQARTNLESVARQLRKVVDVKVPDGGYFLFVDFSPYAPRFASSGYVEASSFLLHQAKVATISGIHFGASLDALRFFVRINCGRSIALLDEAVRRIEKALT